MNLPAGYRYASLYAGIRSERKDDLALILSDAEASAGAMFTTNRVQASPVKLARKHLSAARGKARAILVNAGNANCATRTGDKVALQCCRAVAAALKAPVTQVLPASTGVIGVELDPSPITGKIPQLIQGLSPERFADVAAAIMTTDTVPKMAASDAAHKRGLVKIAGVAKGAGMIHPNMATMLCFVVTDAALEPFELWEALVPSVEHSFHRLSIDGDTSTNDAVIVLANGASGEKPDRKRFQQALTDVLQQLAVKIARDGEGARKLITVDVTGAPNDGAAARIARSVANSPLVKTAIAGEDANWGRVLAAAGYAGIPFDPARVDVYIQGIRVCRSGLAAPFSERALEVKLGAPECEIRVAMHGRGKGKARFWTCDFTEGYIHVNADYRT
ncbi:MAG: bifunctional glutamate N-acetyltransferase/amino-acid acetyltransferase ArgJ [Bryobacteraceae bacterium]|nr:bifunctional glutamate N-acetyltransferase/amino-acid acetyltransferase ArgJ [Bryobacteraceae bacterium]